MKNLPKPWGRGAALAAATALAFSQALAAQSGPVVSAVPGQRPSMPLPAAEKDGTHLTLDQAIGLALANNQDLNVTVNAAEASQFLLLQNQGIFDPLLQAFGTRSHNDTPSASELAGAALLTQDTWDAGVQVSQLIPWGGTFTLGFSGGSFETNSIFYDVNPAYSANLNLLLSQPLLRNFGKLATTWRIDTARYTRDASYQFFVRSVQDAVNATEQAYWDLVFAYQNLEVRKEARRLAVDLNRITKIKIDVGSLAPIDIVQTEVDIAVADQDIINAEGLIGNAQDQLKRLLNFDPTLANVPIIPTDPVKVETQEFDVQAGVRDALAHRPEVLAQRYSIASSALAYEFWKNQTLPALDLRASYGKNGLDGLVRDPDTGQIIADNGWGDAASQLFSENFKDWSVGLVFSYPILNRSAKGARGVARYTLETSRARLTVLEQDIIVGVRAAHRAIDVAAKQIAAARKSRELAERNLDASRKKYDNGMSTSFEVSQITNDLSDAQSRELNALVIYRKAVSAYHNAVGDILQWKRIQVDGLPEATPIPSDEVQVAASR